MLYWPAIYWVGGISSYLMTLKREPPLWHISKQKDELLLRHPLWRVWFPAHTSKPQSLKRMMGPGEWRRCKPLMGTCSLPASSGPPVSVSLSIGRATEPS